jgi:thioredoxin 1
VVEQVAGENKGVKFLGLDVHNNYDTASNFGIMSIPQLLFFKDGKETGRVVGYPKDVKAKIEAELKKIK